MANKSKVLSVSEQIQKDAAEKRKALKGDEGTTAFQKQVASLNKTSKKSSAPKKAASKKAATATKKASSKKAAAKKEAPAKQETKVAPAKEARPTETEKAQQAQAQQQIFDASKQTQQELNKAQNNG